MSDIPVSGLDTVAGLFPYDKSLQYDADISYDSVLFPNSDSLNISVSPTVIKEAVGTSSILINAIGDAGGIQESIGNSNILINALGNTNIIREAIGSSQILIELQGYTTKLVVFGSQGKSIIRLDTKIIGEAGWPIYIIKGMKPTIPSIYKESQHERQLGLRQTNNEQSFIYQLALYITECTEHISYQLIPLYNRIVSAKTPNDIIDLTVHERLVVRLAAIHRIDELEGRFHRKEPLVLFPEKYIGKAWNAPRSRFRNNTGGVF